MGAEFAEKAGETFEGLKKVGYYNGYRVKKDVNGVVYLWG
jgi:hypothetical protein